MNYLKRFLVGFLFMSIAMFVSAGLEPASPWRASVGWIAGLITGFIWAYILPDDKP